MNAYDLCGYLGLVIELFGLWIVGRHRSYGWLVGAFGASLWIIYAVAGSRWPVLASTILFGATYLNNWRRSIK